MSLKSKSFEARRISVIEDQMNEFLKTIDANDFVDMKLVLGKSDNTSPPEFFAAIIIYR